VTPLAIDAGLFPRVQLVLDASLKSSSEIYGVHAFSSDTTAFIKGSEIAAYLSKFEIDDAKITEIDFAELKTEAPAPKPAAAPKAAAPAKAKAAAKEDTVQIGILYKKDEDFAGWYTDVSEALILQRTCSYTSE